MSTSVQTLTAHDVLAIHEALTEDSAGTNDPISPPGVRSLDLLESAVARQHTGLGARLKYDTPVSNAASLAYGLCMNHPFFNGNKRTSLVSMLCHLDANDLTFTDEVKQADLYDLMLKIAKHGFTEAGVSDADLEVDQIARWIRKRSRRLEKRERVVTYRELMSTLKAFGFVFEDHRNNSIDLVRYEVRTSWFGLSRRTERNRYMRMPYPGDGAVVSKDLVREIRERCALNEKNGCDSISFYSERRAPDFFIAKYRKTLHRLARV